MQMEKLKIHAEAHERPQTHRSALHTNVHAGTHMGKQNTNMQTHGHT